MKRDRVFLVTGATGAIGSALVPLLLAEPATKVHLLLRATSDQLLDPRMQALLDYWGDRVDAKRVENRLFGVPGDISRPQLGMNDRDHSVLAGTVTDIVHAAGNVALNQSLEDARKSAVFSAQEVVRFARVCGKSGPSPKVEYLSTVGVAGRRPGVVPETPLEAKFGYHNTYEQAKAEAEAVVLREIAEGLRATVHRPSMVVGDSQDGRIIHFQVFYYLIRFLAGSRTKGVLPEFGDVKLDLVPADYVARAILASGGRQDSLGRILHLCSGPRRSVTLAKLGDMLRQFLSRHGEKVFPPRYVSLATMRTLLRIACAVATKRSRRAFDTLPYFLEYLDEAQLFASADTDAFLAADGLECPPVDGYLPAVLEYWYARRHKPPASRGARH